MFQYLVIVGAVVQLVGVFSYLKGTIRGETKPNRITWFMWSIAPLIATAAGLASGVTWAVLPVFMSGFGPLIIFIASFVNKNAYWKLEIFDWLCGIFSALALILWWITKDPVVAIVFAILSDLSAGLPTIIKSWKFPETENATTFFTGLFNALTSFAAIKIWVFSSYAFISYIAVMDSLIALTILRKKIFKTEKK